MLASLALPELLGPVQVVTPPSGLVVSLVDAKQSCRVEYSDEDVLITTYIQAAQDLAAQALGDGRELRSAVYDVPLSRWWDWDPVGLPSHQGWPHWNYNIPQGIYGVPLLVPRPPLQSVASITWYDSNGNAQTLDPSKYLVEVPQRQFGRVWLNPSWARPYLDPNRPHPIIVRINAGYASADSVPAGIKAAILMLVTHWYDRRAAVSVANLTEAPLAFRALLESESWGGYC